MSFSISLGTSLGQMLQAMGHQQTTDAESDQPPVKRARLKGRFKADDPATADVDEAWSTES